jgi:hypothetical protein
MIELIPSDPERIALLALRMPLNSITRHLHVSYFLIDFFAYQFHHTSPSQSPDLTSAWCRPCNQSEVRLILPCRCHSPLRLNHSLLNCSGLASVCGPALFLHAPLVFLEFLSFRVSYLSARIPLPLPSTSSVLVSSSQTGPDGSAGSVRFSRDGCR